MKPAIPWALCAVLAIGTIGMNFYYRGALETKSAELSAAQEKYAKLESSSSAALKDASDKLTSTQSKLVEVATDASKKVQELAAQAEARTQALAAEANAKLQEANLPEVTVLVGFRKALMSSGSVARLKNVSPASISLTVTASRPSTAQSKMFRFVIDSSGIKEFGEQEGWAFIKGDQLKVEQPGHKGKIWTLS
jgi:dsDNA-specific endonuclease/ATPase MutS2